MLCNESFVIQLSLQLANKMELATNVTEELSITVEEIPLADRAIAGVLWILYEFPGNALMLGMVQFDRFGGDPLKRRITDQVTFLLLLHF